VSEDGGGSWRRIERVGSVPELTYVSDLEASRHDVNAVYAAFDNHKMGDYQPYLYRSGDRGRTWTSISGDLPPRGTVYTVAEDPERSDLLYAGTEFGLFFSIDGRQALGAAQGWTAHHRGAGHRGAGTRGRPGDRQLPAAASTCWTT